MIVTCLQNGGFDFLQNFSAYDNFLIYSRSHNKHAPDEFTDKNIITRCNTITAQKHWLRNEGIGSIRYMTTYAGLFCKVFGQMAGEEVGEKQLSSAGAQSKSELVLCRNLPNTPKWELVPPSPIVQGKKKNLFKKHKRKWGHQIKTERERAYEKAILQ